jgi:metal-responsive CopG/Arc/MetJ family transcriptional regulator
MMPRRLDAEKLTRVPIAFPEDLYEWVRETAHARRVSMAEIVREAVSEYRDRTDPRLELWGRREDGGN